MRDMTRWLWPLCAALGCSSATFVEGDAAAPDARRPDAVTAPPPDAPCPAGQTLCGASCVTLSSDARHCGACGNACPAGVACREGRCPPANDDLAHPTSFALAAGERLLRGTTDGASFDGPAGCASGPNVWYRFTLSQPEVVYLDTAGSAYDTAIYLVDARGAVVSGACNDDAACNTREFTMKQSRLAAVLDAGSYSLAVSGPHATDRGEFTLHAQHVAASFGRYFQREPVAASGAVSRTLPGASALSPRCVPSVSGEDVYWFVTCGAPAPSLFSLCRADGGSFVRASGATTYDPVMYVYDGLAGSITRCANDADGCAGTGGDTGSYGPRIEAALPRGLHAVVVDEGLRPGGGMRYTLRHVIQ